MLKFRNGRDALLVAAHGVEELDTDVEAITLKAIAGGEAEMRCYLQFCKCMEFRRAFVCLACYRHLDDNRTGGQGVVIRDGKARLFNLAGSSRGGKAAVYNCEKYRRYQAKRASEIGIDMEA